MNLRLICDNIIWINIIMKLSVDNQQRVTTGMLMILEFYKVMMATFLVIFVPQDCNDKVCTLTENFNNTDSIHRAALISNFATFLYILNFYRNEIMREEWCIKYLDIDPGKPNNYLDEEIEDYPLYKIQMKSMNKEYLNSLYIASGLLLYNFGISGVAIGQNYQGANTLTSIISFLLLLGEKLFSSYNVGKKSVKDERAFSAYMKISRTYNTIDEDFRMKEDLEEPPKENINDVTHNDGCEVASNVGNIVVEMIENNK